MAFKFNDLFNPLTALTGLGGAVMGSPNSPSARQGYNQQLQNRLGGINPPNMSDYYAQQRQQILGQYKAPQTLSFDGLNQMYNTAKAGLNQTMGNQVADASSQAGALAGARGFANPSAFVGSQANQVRQSFVPQFANLESDAAKARFDVEKYNNALQNQGNQDYTNLLIQLAQLQGQGSQADYANQMGLFNAYSGLADNYDPYNNYDKAFNLFSNLLPSAVNLAGV